MQCVHAAAGEYHTVLLRSDGEAVAFGSNFASQCNVQVLPPGMQYVHVSAGGYHTVLLRSDGEAVDFGRNSGGQCDVPVLPSGMQYLHAAAGNEHTVVFRSDGEAVAFGRNSGGRCDVPLFASRMQGLHDIEIARGSPSVGIELSIGGVLYPQERLAKPTLWSPQRHKQFPKSSRDCEKLALLLQLRMRQSGLIGFAFESCLIGHILPFVVPVIVRRPQISENRKGTHRNLL